MECGGKERKGKERKGKERKGKYCGHYLIGEKNGRRQKRMVREGGSARKGERGREEGEGSEGRE